MNTNRLNCSKENVNIIYDRSHVQHPVKGVKVQKDNIGCATQFAYYNSFSVKVHSPL